MLTIYNDTAIHEAGHTIVSYLASDLFEIKSVTANKGISQSMDPKSVGGVSQKFKKTVNSLTSQDHDLVILCALAGMAADDINHSEGRIDKSFYDKTTIFQKLESNKYQGDRDRLGTHLDKIELKIVKGKSQYIVSCLQLLHQIFTIKEVNKILIELRHKIDSSDCQTMSGNDVMAFLDKTELQAYRENEWKKIMKIRASIFIKKSRLNRLSDAIQSVLTRRFCKSL